MSRLVHKLGAGLSVLPTLLLPASALAQLDKAEDYLEDVGDAVTAEGGQLQSDLPTLIGDIINVLLSIIGVFLVIIFVYAGFLYLSDAGDGAKVGKAKKLMGQVVIGAIIIIAAYAISNFLVTALQDIAT